MLAAARVGTAPVKTLLTAGSPVFDTVMSGPRFVNRCRSGGDRYWTEANVGFSCCATGTSSLMSGSMFTENVCSLAIVALVSFRTAVKREPTRV